MITGLRIRKFSVGKYETASKKCLSSWIEIEESDLDKFDLVNHGLVTDKVPVKKGKKKISVILSNLFYQINCLYFKN